MVVLAASGTDLIPGSLPLALVVVGVVAVAAGVAVSHAITREIGLGVLALAALAYAARGSAGAFGWAFVAVPLFAAAGEAAHLAADRRTRNSRVIVEADANRAALGASAAIVVASLGAVALVWAAVRAASSTDPASGANPSGPGVFLALALGGLAVAVGVVALGQRRLASRRQALERPLRGVGLAVGGSFVLASILGVGAIARLDGWSGSNANSNSGAATASADAPGSESLLSEPQSNPLDSLPEDGPLWVIFGAMALLLGLLLLLGRRETIIPPADLQPDAAVRLEGGVTGAMPTIVETVDRAATVSSLDDALVALDVGSDHAAAVRLAYATVADGFGRAELKRRPAETEGEYLARVLGDLGSDAPALNRLTALFSRARFSAETVDAAARDEARAALQTIRSGVSNGVAAGHDR